MKKTLKIIISLLLVSVLAISITSCNKVQTIEEKDSTKENQTPLKEITLCLDWTPNTNHTGLFAAQKLGYYKNAGLDVKIVQPPESGAVQCCASGQAQFAIDAQDTFMPVINSDIGSKVTTVAAIVQHNTSGIVSKKGAGITSPKGLEGKEYLTWDTPIDKAMMKYCVEKDGGDWSKVTLVPNAVTEEAEDVNANPTHAIWVFYGWSVINGNTKGIDTDFFFFKDIDPAFDYYTPTIVANTQFLSDDPETAKAFMAATRKGYEFSAENPENAAKILIECDNTHSLDGLDTLVTESQKYLSEQYIADAPYWGYIDTARWDAFYKWLYDEKLIDNELPSSAGMTTEFLAK